MLQLSKADGASSSILMPSALSFKVDRSSHEEAWGAGSKCGCRGWSLELLQERRPSLLQTTVHPGPDPPSSTQVPEGGVQCVRRWCGPAAEPGAAAVPPDSTPGPAGEHPRRRSVCAAKRRCAVCGAAGAGEHPPRAVTGRAVPARHTRLRLWTV